MARLNGQEIDLANNTVSDVGKLLREAVLATPAGEVVTLTLSSTEEMQLAFDELAHPRREALPERTMGMMLAQALTEECNDRMEATIGNFSYSNLSFTYSGEIIPVGRNRRPSKK